MNGYARRGKLAAWTGEWVDYGYRRVSSDDQEKDGMSLPVQDEQILGYVAGLDGANFAGMFTDVQTGADAERPDYQRMLAAVRADVAAGRRCRITVVKQSRFGRDIEELSRAWKELVVRLDVQFHVTRDGGHARDEMMFLIKGVMNHHELTVISEGVRNSFARGREGGWLKPGRPRWGYAWKAWSAGQKPADAFNVYPAPHEIEADYVRELFAKRADGASYRQLTDWVQRLPDAARGGRQLSVSSIKDALDSPVYVARNGALADDVLDRPPGRWEPLCDDETWARIHPRADERENPVRTASLRGEYPLTGYLFCEACGARMAGQVRRGYRRARPGRRERTDPDRRVYICSSRMSGAAERVARGDRPCYRTIDAEIIERQMFTTFANLVSSFGSPGIKELARRAASELASRDAATGNARRLINAERERKECSNARADLTIALAQRVIDADAYAEAAGRLTEQIRKLDDEIARLGALEAGVKRRSAGRPLVEVIIEQAPFWSSAILDGSVDDQREFLRLVLDSATPHRVANGVYTAGMKLTATGRALLEIGAELMPATGFAVEDVQLAWANCTTSTAHGRDAAA